MTPRRRGVWLFVASAGALVVVALPFALRWSRTCAEERARAEETWTEYADHMGDTRAGEEARRVLDVIDRDLPAALERGEGMLTTPPPADAEGARLYREAMERLVLADGACSTR